MKNILSTIITSVIICSFMTVSTAFAGDDPLGKKYKTHYAKQASQASNLDLGGEYTPQPRDHEEPVYCGDILSEPGFYRLDSSLECTSSIEITSSNVYLNLDRHTLTCNPEEWEYPDGTPAENRESVVNAISVNFNDFEDPSLEPVVTNVHISNGTITNCHIGVLLYKADRSSVSRMTLRDNVLDAPCCWAKGIEMVESHNNKILRNKISANSQGIAMFYSMGNSLGRNKVMNTLQDGIILFDSNGNSIKRNEANGNLWGIWIQNSSDNNISKNKSMENADSGITLVEESNRNRILQNQLDGNGVGGLLIYGVTVAGESIGAPIPANNLIKGNTAQNNIAIDVLEANLDFSDFDFVDVEILPGDQCYNIWLENTYDNAFAIADCIN